MAAGHDQEKTEPATQKKRDDARRKGQIAKSPEISSTMILAAALGVFFFAGGWLLKRLIQLMQGVFLDLSTTTVQSPAEAATFLGDIFLEMGILMAPLLLAVLTAGFISNVAQVGFMLTSETLTPDLTKLNPISGMKKFVSIKSFVELVKSLLKMALIGVLAYSIVKGKLTAIPGLMQLPISDIMGFVGDTIFMVAFYVCVAMAVLASLDYAFQKWQHEKDLRMSKQEVKDEHKQTQGDPLIKSRIRKAQREMAMQRMMAAVPNADVVITNPTHLAIALRFDPESMDAPRVVAKGAGHVAQRIKEIALENQVAVVEQKPLARALFKSVEIDADIPSELYRAVAEILAYVYRLKGRRPAM